MATVLFGLAVTTVAVVGATPAAAQSSDIGITNVSAEPEQAVPGELVTIRATVSNADTSDSTVNVETVYVRELKRSGFTTHERVEGLGALSAGSEMRVPLSVTFDNEGTKDLRVVASVTDNGERIRVSYPATVRVADRHPRVDIETNDSVAVKSNTGTVRVANGLPKAARNVEVQLSSDGLDLENERTVVPEIQPGESAEADLEFSSDTPGRHEITATVRYNVAGSGERVVNETVTVDVDPLRENVVVDAERRSGEDASVDVDVTNLGNAAIENVTVTGEAADAAVRGAFLERVPAQSSRSVVLNASLDSAAVDASINVNYDIGDRSGVATDDVRITGAPGNIDLTGIDVSSERGRHRITGSTSNLGGTEATSVVVSVADTAQVSPTPPSGEYFVGRVPASDFASFDVTAAVDGNASEIPLEVQYRADGELRTETISVPLRDAAVQSFDRQAQSGETDDSMGLVVPGVALVVIIAIAFVVVRAWRRSRGDT